MADESGAARPGRGRRLAVRALLVLGAVCAALGLVAGYANRKLLDGPTFADHVDEIRRDAAVAEQAGAAIAASSSPPARTSSRSPPLVQDVSVRVAGGPLLSAPTGGRRRRRWGAHGGGLGPVVLRIVDVGVVVTGVLAPVAPERAPNAGEISVTLADDRLAGVRVGDHRARPCRRRAGLAAPGAGARRVRRGRRPVRRPLAGGRVRRLGAGVGRARSRRRPGRRRLPRPPARRRHHRLGRRPGPHGRSWCVRCGGGSPCSASIGVAVVLACGSTAPLAVRAQAAGPLRAVGRPETATGRILRAVLAAVVGLAAILDPLGLLEPLVALAGVVVVLLAAAEIAEIAGLDRGAAGVDPASAPDAGRSGAPGPSAWWSGGWRPSSPSAVVALARPARDATSRPPAPAPARSATATPSCATAVRRGRLRWPPTTPCPWPASPGGSSPSRSTRSPCSSTRACGRCWSTCGRAVDGRLRRAHGAGSYAEARAIAEEELGPEVVAAAARIADSVAGTADGPEARFLCHGLCETGSTPFLEHARRASAAGSSPIPTRC